MRLTTSLLATVCLLTGGSAAFAQELTYYLPAGTLAAGWQARIENCPELPKDWKGGRDLTDEEKAKATLVINAQPAVAGAYAKGELIRLNPNSPFLASRSVALNYHENGLLKTINAEGAGQGGPVLASLLKTVAGFIALGPVSLPAAAVPKNFLRSVPAGDGRTRPEPVAECTPATKKKVDRWQTLVQRIDATEGAVAGGGTLSGARLALYEEMKKERAALESDLMISTSHKWTPARSKVLKDLSLDDEDILGLDSFDPSLKDVVKIAKVAPIDLSPWFKTPPALEDQVGRFGFCARYTIKAVDILNASASSRLDIRRWRDKHVVQQRIRTVWRDHSQLHDRFVYLQPVPVTVELLEKKDDTACAGEIAADRTRKEPELKKLAGKSVAVPQLSDYFILPLGSGLFESKSTGAEFAADGRIVSLSHKATGGGAGFAEALAGGLTAAETLRDAETKQIQREIERKKAQDELGALLETDDKSKVNDDPPQ